MRIIVTLVAPEGALTNAILAEAAAALNAAGASTGEAVWLAPARAVDLPCGGIALVRVRQAVVSAMNGVGVDHCVMPADGRRKRLLIADMDSTILINETLDEISAQAGIGDIVAEITARSMRGELNFEDSLRERVALLEGHASSIIDTVLDTISMSPGAAAFVATMRRHGAYTALISGGFSMFADKVRNWLGFHIAKANDFEIVDGRLTGRLTGDIVGRETKLAWLEDLCAKHNISTANALTIGDGANDLAMVTAAGLGIAYYGKPVLSAAADARIDHTDLRSALYFQGYRDDEIVERWSE